MKTLKFSTLLVFLLTFAWSASAERQTKKYYKAYDVSEIQKLDINNKYGNIFIENNRTDSVTLSVVVWADGNYEKAKKILNAINVTIAKNGNTLSAITEVLALPWGNNEYSIDYHVAIPKDRDLVITQKYGNVNVKDLTGKGTFKVDYGELYGQSFLSPELKMNLSYSRGRIEEVKNLTFGFSYISRFEIGQSEELQGESRYSTIKLNNCDKLNLNSRYDNYEIGSIGSLAVNSMYTGINVEKLNASLNLVNGYGGLTVAEVSDNFESIVIQNKYAGIKLGLSPDASYKFRAMAHYAEIRHPEGKLNKKREATSYEVEGIIGKSESPKATIKIDTNYGNVNLTR